MRILLACLCCALMALTAVASDNVFPALDQQGRALYHVAITTPRASVTGVCIIKCENDTLKGTIVNEFGVCALSFWVSPDRRKVKLQNVMSMLNKWYIKRTISGDLKHLFNTTATTVGQQHKHRLVQLLPDGQVVLTNTRRHLTYDFKPIHEESHETAE